MKKSFVFLAQILALIQPCILGLAVSERAQAARSRLYEAFFSPAGKLTLSPEIVIPEPTDPTAILLQASGVQDMSAKIRTQAKANSAFISGAVTSLKTFCSEQESARGNFPGPVPTIFCDVVEDLSEVADAGAEGLLVPVCGGKEVSSVDDLAADLAWVETCKAALSVGLQPIPEVNIADSSAANWNGDTVEALVAKIAELAGEDPVSVLLTISAPIPEASDSDGNEGEEEEEKTATQVSLPEVPKPLGKKIPIIGSVKAKAGAGRMGEETSRFKAAGFTGAVLRKECITALSMSQDLEYLTNFWGACIGDLKSLKSKSFNFQARNYLDKSAPLEWAKYQKSVLESGALGEAEEVPSGLNPSQGDYQGF